MTATDAAAVTTPPTGRVAIMNHTPAAGRHSAGMRRSHACDWLLRSRPPGGPGNSHRQQTRGQSARRRRQRHRTRCWRGQTGPPQDARQVGRPPTPARSRAFWLPTARALAALSSDLPLQPAWLACGRRCVHSAVAPHSKSAEAPSPPPLSAAAAEALRQRLSSKAPGINSRPHRTNQGGAGRGA